MKKTANLITGLLFLLAFAHCGVPNNNAGGERASLDASAFEQRLGEAGMQLIDVRTAEEFSGGHLPSALNFDVRSSDFEQNVNGLDKEKPVLVYCLSGGRSTEAANRLSDMGFKKVYDLEGGILAWQSAGKTLESVGNDPVATGMTEAEFEQQLNVDKYVLVDYNAKWCKPCVQMSPMLEKVAEEKKDKMVLMRVDADDNKALMLARGISSVPYFELYKNDSLLWKHEGAIDEATLLKETKL